MGDLQTVALPLRLTCVRRGTINSPDISGCPVRTRHKHAAGGDTGSISAVLGAAGT